MKTQELIYQIFPQTFKDGSQKGTGDLKGIIEKLDYLQWLGVNRIWLCPIFLSPFADSGYDITNYYEIDPRFGSMIDLEILIKEAEKRKITLIFDMVFNHTSDQNEWFQKALTGDSKYQDYYFFKTGEKNKPPTNWKSKMGGSAWKFVSSLGKYYLHLYAENQPDLNWENSNVRQEILKILNFWIAKGIKGFRFDVCNVYDKSQGFENDNQGDGRRFYTDGVKIPEYLGWMNQNSFGLVDDFLTVGEISSTTKEKSIHYITPQHQKLDTLFTFLHLKVDFKNNQKWTYMLPDVQTFSSLMEEWQIYFQKYQVFPSLFLNNHDQPRSLSRFGDEKKWWFESATGLAAFIYLMRGITFIYQGEEIGMTNFPFQKLSDFWDVETLGNIQDLKKIFNNSSILKIAKSKARDNSRSVMQWTTEKNAGFSKATSKIPINPNYLKINVAKQITDPKSILSFYKKIFTLKKNQSAIYEGTIEFLNLANLFAYQRKTKTQTILVIFNWSNQNISLKEKVIEDNANILLNNYDNFDFMKLEPYQVIVMGSDWH